MIQQIGFQQREQGCLVMQMRFPIFAFFCIGQRFMKFVYEARSNNIKKI